MFCVDHVTKIMAVNLEGSALNAVDVWQRIPLFPLWLFGS